MIILKYDFVQFTITDEYTKITTPRQDVLFKKGYFGRKRISNPPETQEVHSTGKGFLTINSNDIIFL